MTTDNLMHKTWISADPRIISTGIYYIIYAILGMNLAALGPSINDFTRLTSTNVETFSAIFLIRSSGGLLGAFIGTRLYDKFSPKLLSLIILGVVAILLSSLPFATEFIITMVIFFCIGYIHFTLVGGGNILIARMYADKTAPFLSGLHFSFGVGAFIMPLIIARIRPITGSAIYAYWIIAGLSVLLFFLMLINPAPPTASKPREQRPATAASSLTLTAAFFFFFLVGAEITFGAWIYNYSLLRNIATPETAAILTSLFYGVYTATRLISIPVLMLVSSQIVVLFSLTGAAIVAAIFFAAPASTLIIFILTGFMGFFLASIVPIFFSIIEEKTGLNGKNTSTLQVGMCLGGMFFPWLSGQLFPKIGQITLPIIMSFTCFVALILAVLVIKK